MIAAERETTVTSTDEDELIHIWTAQRRYIGRLRRHPAYTEVASGTHDSSEWAQFTIPAVKWNPASGAKRERKPLTEEQRAAVADRLRKAREAGVPPWEQDEEGDD